MVYFNKEQTNKYGPTLLQDLIEKENLKRKTEKYWLEFWFIEWIRLAKRDYHDKV